MLHLASRTSAGWAKWAADHVDAILLDHAHCEKKAASTAINLVFKYGDVEGLPAALSAFAREELEHFELVLEHLRRRGVAYRRAPASPYAGKLHAICRAPEPARLLDTLLCCAMIEARSCERMQLLHEELRARPDADPALVDLYGSLLASEARHHASYLDLARTATDVDEASLRARLREIASHESAVIDALPIEPRLHDRAPP